MLAEIGHQGADVVGRHLQAGLVHELRPAEAVAAVRVAGLALPREEQHGLGVLVLQAGQWPAVQAGRVQQQLPSRVRVQPDLVRRGAQPGRGRTAVEQVRDPAHVRLGQHVRLGEDEPVDRVVGSRVPVDEVLDHVRVRPEREHGRHRPYREPFPERQAGPLRQHVQMLRRVSPKSATGRPAWRYDLLDVSHATSPSVWRARGLHGAKRAKIAPQTPAPQRFPHLASFPRRTHGPKLLPGLFTH
jgi:hypothetical protein